MNEALRERLGPGEPTTLRKKERAAAIALIRKRDGNLCHLCGRRLGAPKTATQSMRLNCEVTIDHLVPRSRGGGDDLPNLRLAHRLCNEVRGLAGVSYRTRDKTDLRPGYRKRFARLDLSRPRALPKRVAVPCAGCGRSAWVAREVANKNMRHGCAGCSADAKGSGRFCGGCRKPVHARQLVCLGCGWILTGDAFAVLERDDVTPRQRACIELELTAVAQVGPRSVGQSGESVQAYRKRVLAKVRQLARGL